MTRNALVTSTIEQLRPYAAGKPIEELQRELGLTDVCKLASNENPLGPSPGALQAVVDALPTVHRYPDAAAFYLRERLCVHLSNNCRTVHAEELVFGNGSNELLELLVRTFTTNDDHVVFADPSFVVYRSAALAHGVPFTAVPLTAGYVHDLDALLAAVESRTRMVFIANPNNPTGTYVAEEPLRRFLQELPASVIPVLDEAYFEYASAGDYPDGLNLRDAHPKLVVLRTFSKAYGLAGLRIGYAVCPPELVGYLNRVRAPFNANSLAQVAAIAALGDAAHLDEVVKVNDRERALLAAELSAAGLDAVPSEANFVLVDLKTDAMNIYSELLQLGVITRPIPPLPTCLRITIGSARENQRLLAALRACLS